jgi:hypothetical protein
VKDAQQTLVVDQEKQRSWVLRDVEAVIWDLLTVGYSYQELVSMLSLLLALPTEESARTLVDALRRWREVGILHVSREPDGG